MNYSEIKDLTFDIKHQNFDDIALKVFEYQSKNCKIYSQFIKFLNFDTNLVKKIEDIPFLPIEFFKTHQVKTNEYDSDKIFESSSTTGLNTSKHHIKLIKNYEKSFTECFNNSFFNNFKNYVHLALLPNYLERNNSSLVYQVKYFIENSNFPESQFILGKNERLFEILKQLNKEDKPVLLWAVTYAILDFAENFEGEFTNTILIETGGMKGRRKEMIKSEFYEKISKKLIFKQISSEYGMTELMSQCYADKNNQFKETNSIKVLIKEMNDPNQLVKNGRTGVINIIDLNNLDSCCFIGTSDLGRKISNDYFEVLGRLDFAEMRGCNLMV